ncbi:hypothetical protein, variant [Blastomyces dermatitidis ER-3]|uniref:Arrestin domain-containing protein n=3 Tax=Blastomyces TaxID=229219 RepID=A0A179V260_BLAGS|nr:hypothetical protein, variant [Blastomyces gilchristii SLH14081]XP_045281924.1 hypothetical protein, variant [Blastomyces dermatitidis ER-3]EQL34936.1 hypothetical protein, variant [Blastomyces dermatitidis ATCC 26199]KMW67453.1 hypothetical protein, variant [Blastomyces dermatitidis ATCC 18188]OAT02197.1 hypothetical protein, variant [Blastomyces dermatitidis ER-3]OAT12692.1 hypothetical protein, variant [Blastomyces gilchristii SLH14081]
MTAINISIQLDSSRNLHGPLLFLNDNGVAGKVVVYSCDSAQFDSVRIILEGTIRSSLISAAIWSSAQGSRMEMKQKLIHMQTSLQKRNHQPDDQGTSSQRADCRIAYTLHAYLMRNGSTTTGTFRHVMLFPTQEPQPPSCTSDFPGDYALSRSAVLRTAMLFRRLGQLSVETMEPAPLEMSRKKNGASTAIHLVLRFRESRERSKCESMSPPTPDFGAVSLKLKQMTFISVEPQRRLPATRDLLTSPLMAKDTEIIYEQLRKLKFSPWVRSRWKEEDGGISDQERRVWETKATLIFTYANGKRPAPTFSSALVSRRYSVRIAFRLERVYHGTLELEVPLQIIYRGDGQIPLSDESELGDSELASSDETLTLRSESQSTAVTLAAENEQAPDYVP